MPAGLPIAFALLLQAAIGPSATAAPADSVAAEAKSVPPSDAPAGPPADERCVPPAPEPGTSEIVVCAQRKQSYRIDPDIREAERGHGGSVPAKRDPAPKDQSCATVGPMGCRDGGVNLLGAAIFAGKLAAAAGKGENVGQLFVTDPQADEYQRYREAKRRREAREAEEALATKIAASKAEAALEAQEKGKEQNPE